MKVIFESWTVDDLPQIAALEKATFLQYWTQKMLEDSFLLPSTITLAAKTVEGKVCGHIFGVQGENVVDIISLIVAKEFRGQKIGTQLLQQFENLVKMRNVYQLFLDVRVTNATAMQLYLKQGFVGQYARTRYYDNGEDALIMRKDLKG